MFYSFCENNDDLAVEESILAICKKLQSLAEAHSSPETFTKEVHARIYLSFEKRETPHPSFLEGKGKTPMFLPVIWRPLITSWPLLCKLLSDSLQYLNNRYS